MSASMELSNKTIRVWSVGNENMKSLIKIYETYNNVGISF